MLPDQEELLALEPRIGVLQLDVPVPQRLHLAPDEREAGLDALVEVILVEGPPVDGDVAVSGLVAHSVVRNPMSTRSGNRGPGISARFSRTRLRSSTKTTLGS